MEEKIKIALAGNPNSGKTTLFNALTGSNQFVGNWPGVTVEKKEGRLKKHSDVIIEDLPGIYSLSPYTLEEVVSRTYLVEEKPDAILDIVDGTNLERNLYLTTQLIETGIPVVIAVNMMDIVRKNGDKIDIKKLQDNLGCKIVEISALKETGIMDAAEAAIAAAKAKKPAPVHPFSKPVEDVIQKIEDTCLDNVDPAQKRWYAVKVFERDDKVLSKLNVPADKKAAVEEDIKAVEKQLDDDAESIITNERYVYITDLLKGVYRKKGAHELSASDKIDKIVTNRWLGLPIFALVMFIVYWFSIATVGTAATDWVNDGVFGDGWFLFGNGRSAYDEAVENYKEPSAIIEAFTAAAEDAGAIDTAKSTDDELVFIDDKAEKVTATATVRDDDGNVEETIENVDYAMYKEAAEVAEPDPHDYGVWVDGLPVLIENGLNAINCAPWLSDLILNGIVAGVGAVLGFLPQMLALFLCLAFLEGCGYMARIAFVMDRIFRKFGLSGKSFIPMLIGSGCGVPGVMASRTIENERDRRMTVMTTTFIPCSAKLPIIAMIAGALFNNSAWVATSCYFVGVAAIVISGIILKKTKMFAGEPAPFVMELPAYHWPTVSNILHSMWERAWSFVKKAGSVILLSTIFVWFTSSYGFVDGKFGAVSEDESILAAIGRAVQWIFIPQGFGNWRATVAIITGLVAKENVVGTMGILYGGFDEVAENGWQVWENLRANFTPITGYSFLVFNLLCAPCFAAIGAIKREMNSAKWTWFAIGYQCALAYAVSLCITQIGNAVTGNANAVGLIASIAIIAFIVYMLVRPYHEATKLTTNEVNTIESSMK